MSWVQQLYQTYENKITETDSAVPMTPVAHMNCRAQIEITLNEDGEFQSAILVNKEDELTLIPVTEQSAGRSSGAAPHALCDTLSYIAGDYASFCEKNKLKTTAENRFEMYFSNLKQWADSEYSHPKVRAVCLYISKKCLIHDLIHAGILQPDEKNCLDDIKINGQPSDKAMVRFRVINQHSGSDKTWEDVSLIENYTNYYLSSLEGKKDICYLSGADAVISENHPKGILPSDYGAKLVSGNDSQGLTFRGRFHSSEQACALSYEASQKIHSALTWLVKNLGAYTGSKDRRMFVCWNSAGKETPDIFTWESIYQEEEETYDDIFYQDRLKRFFRGYSDKFTADDTVTVIGLDAATTGRLSIIYYNEFSAQTFFDRMTLWGATCCWSFLQFKTGEKPSSKIQTPDFRRIVNCAYGSEKNKFIEADDKVLKLQTQRLLKCMLENLPVPYDMVHSLMLRASTPLAYSSFNREIVLFTACAMIHKYYTKNTLPEKGEDETMKLDYENTDRSYLFGRLLAVYEKIERITYGKGEGRTPNAIRLQAAFVNHPFQTWKELDIIISPYIQKLNLGSQSFYKNIIEEIVFQFETDQPQLLNQSLSEMYLLGYYLQRAELNKKQEEKGE